MSWAGAGPRLAPTTRWWSPVDPEAARWSDVPDAADDPDRLVERLDGLRRCQALAALRLDGVPERAGAEAELEPAAAEQVEGGGAACDDGRLAQGEVEDVRATA